MIKRYALVTGEYEGAWMEENPLGEYVEFKDLEESDFCSTCGLGRDEALYCSNGFHFSVQKLVEELRAKNKSLTMFKETALRLAQSNNKVICDLIKERNELLAKLGEKT